MIIYEKDSIGRTVVELVFKNAGSIYAKEGVGYFCSHILNTKGTLSKKEKFYSELEQDAIEINTSITREYFVISVKFLNEKHKKALKSLKDLLLNPNFSQEAFEKSKNEIKAKLKNKQNDNDYIARNNLFKAIFKNTPLQYPVMGEKTEHITLEEIKKFFTKNLTKEHLIILNGGRRVDTDEIIELLPSNSNTPLYFTPQKDEIKTTKNVEQSYIYFASPFNVDYENELHLAKIATFILGAGGFGSRLMEEIRVKRGYAYSAYANNSFTKSYKLLSGYLQTKIENTAESIEIVKQLINDIQQNGITEEELQSAKQFLIGSEPLRNETLIQRLLKKFNEHYLQLPQNYYEKELKLIQNVTLNDINDFLSKHPEIKDLSFSILTKE
jgi:predicted Zn-dependent peptidase